MVERTSALADHYQAGRFGEAGEPGVMLTEVDGLTLHQIAAWPDTIDTVARLAARTAGAASAPGPCTAAVGDNATLLRIEPLKWWLYGAAAPSLEAELGMTLDLSHSRTHLRLTGSDAQLCLNRLVSVDLRDSACPLGTVVSTAMDHVGVTLWRSRDGFELFVPRGFALSVWQVLFDTARQFGVDVR